MELKKNTTYNLVLDRGNTRLKVAVFDHNKKMVFNEAYTLDLVTNLIAVIRHFQPKYFLFSASGKKDDALLDYLKTISPVIYLSNRTPLPISLKYKTPKTLGVDRIANACGAAMLFPEKPVLVVDFGTCITYNFVDQNRNFLGGAIAPGVTMRAKAMHTFTENLPLVKVHDVKSFIGKDTESCLNVGVVEGAKHEIAGYIDQYKEKYPNLTIIFTGGDHSYFVNTIECPIFANFNLTAIGLNEILHHNIT